jgi:hypothetical protein
MAFKFEVLCEDRHLAKVLRLLAGSGVQVGSPIPIVMAGSIVKGNGVLNGAGYVVWQGVLADKLTEVRPKQMSAYLKAAGLSPTSYSYAIKNLTKHRCIKRMRAGVYKVLAAPPLSKESKESA